MELNNIQSTGRWDKISGLLNDNFAKLKLAIETGDPTGPLFNAVSLVGDVTGNGEIKGTTMEISAKIADSWGINKGYLVATAADKNNWNTAFGWGNHASAGYLKTHQSLAGYATQSWVNSQGFLKTHQSLAAYATQAWANTNFMPKRDIDLGNELMAGDFSMLDSYNTFAHGGVYNLIFKGNPVYQMFVGGDTWGHNVRQILIGNLTVTDGKINSTHSDKRMTIVFREYNISGGGTTKVWSEWKNYLDDYATTSWVESKNYLTAHQSLAGYATQSWVNSQGFLKSVTWASVSGKPAWIGSAKPTYTYSEVGAAAAGHNHSGVYEPVFTKNTAFNKNFGTAAGTVAQGNDSRINNGQTAFGWGNHASAGYLKTHQSLAGYATQSWVNSQGFLKTHQSLAAYATQDWTNELVHPHSTARFDSIVASATITMSSVAGTGTIVYVTSSKTFAYKVGDAYYNNWLTADQYVTDNAGKAGVPYKDKLYLYGDTLYSFNGTALIPYATQSWVGSRGYLTSASSLAWAKLTGKPTTIAGYGITDGVTAVSVTGSGNAITAASISGHTLTLTKGTTFLTAHQSLAGYATQTWVNSQGFLKSVAWAGITGKPTTIAGYGITDAKIASGVITIGANSITPLTSHQSLAAYATQAWVTGKGYLVATATDKTNWNNAYSWGNHADVGYATTDYVNPYLTVRFDGIVDSATLESASLTVDAPIYYVKSLKRFAALHQGKYYGNWVGSEIYRPSIDAPYTTKIYMYGDHTYYFNGTDFVEYATQSWVNSQGFLKSHQSLAGYATISWVSANFPTKAGAGASGTWGISITGNATTATTANKLANTLTFAAGTFAAKSYNGAAATTVNVPTHTSHLTNNSGFITSSALTGYATQAWTTSGFLAKKIITLRDSISEANDWSLLDSYNKMDSCGYYLINAYPKDNVAATNPVFMYGDDMGHGMYQVVMGNFATTDGVITGHYDSKMTILYREYRLDPGGNSTVPNRTWGKWKDYLDGYATQAWVESKKYLTTHQPLAGYATQSWVTASFPTKTGTGASGLWGISISGNAATATKLGTATVGSVTKPIYLNGGTAAACGASLAVSVTGNAATATALATGRTINGTSFNGSANIVTSYWGTARTIKIGDQSISVNGSANVTFSRNSMAAAYGREVAYTGMTVANTWYRIASSRSSIYNLNGTFYITLAASGYHSSYVISAGTSYGQNAFVQQLAGTNFSNSIFTDVRIVTSNSYSGNYAYLEIYVTRAISTTFTIRMVGDSEWTLPTTITAGSIPSGYYSKAISLYGDSIIATNFRGNATSATKLKVNDTFDPTAQAVNSSNAGTFCVYDSYEVAGTPTTYGDVIEINSSRASHWKPQLWFDRGANGSLRHRNRNYNTTDWGAWHTLVDSNNYTTIIKKIGTANVGSSALPIYLNAGTPTQCASTLGVSITGNAATATKLTTARSLWGQPFDGTATVSGDMAGVGRLQAQSRFNEYLATYNGTINAKGTICITLPNGFTNAMNIYEIYLYEYINGIAASVITVAGYNYDSKNWINIGYHTKGSYNKKVRLGYNGSKCVIMLGETTTVWQYPQVFLKSVYNGFSGTSGWNGVYSISLITSETGYTSIAAPPKENEYFGNVYASSFNGNLKGNADTATTATTANKVAGTLTFAAGAFAAKTYNGSAAVTVNVPTHTSHLTNNSGFLTSASSLAWAKLTGKPTTLAGYGITDGVNAVSVTGSGNAVTTASVSGHTLTLTKGATFLTAHQSLAAYAKLDYVNPYLTVRFDGMVESATLESASLTVDAPIYYVKSLKRFAALYQGKYYGNWVGSEIYRPFVDAPYTTKIYMYGDHTYYFNGTDLVEYATQAWVNSQGFLKTHQSLTGYATTSWASATFPTKAGSGASGTWGISITGNAKTATTATTANKVAGTLTFAAGAFTVKTYNGSAAVTVNVPTKTSHLTNDSGFLTAHQSLTGYATQTWVNSQGFLKSVAWSGVSGKPTTISGYGITDGVTSVSVTGSGNAITAASISGHTLTLTKGSTFLTSHQSLAAYATTSYVSSNYLKLTGGTASGQIEVRASTGKVASLQEAAVTLSTLSDTAENARNQGMTTWSHVDGYCNFSSNLRKYRFQMGMVYTPDGLQTPIILGSTDSNNNIYITCKNDAININKDALTGYTLPTVWNWYKGTTNSYADFNLGNIFLTGTLNVEDGMEANGIVNVNDEFNSYGYAYFYSTVEFSNPTAFLDQITVDGPVSAIGQMVSKSGTTINGSNSNAQGYLIAGNYTTQHLAIDVSKIQSYNNTSFGALYVNYYGGGIYIGNPNYITTIRSKTTIATNNATGASLQIGLSKLIYTNSTTVELKSTSGAYMDIIAKNTSASSSDARLKTSRNYNVDYCERLMSLGRVFDYKYNDLAKRINAPGYDELTHTGLLYQDVAGVMPHITQTFHKDYGAIDYRSPDLISLIIGATQMNICGIRGLLEKTDNIEDEVLKLKQENERLQMRVKELENRVN